MIQYEDVITIINDRYYIEATAAIAKLINMPIQDDFDMFLKQVSLDCLKASTCSRQELLDCLHNDFDQIISFSVKKWEFLERVEDEQDFPEGEEMGKDDSDEVLQISPLTPAFLIGYLCEFCLLKYKEESVLTTYLKKLKIAGQKKYVKDLKRLFNETRN